MTSVNFHSTDEGNLDAADTGIIHVNLSSADIDGLVDLLRTKNSFLQEVDIRGARKDDDEEGEEGGSGGASSSKPSLRQCDDYEILKHLDTPDDNDDSSSDGKEKAAREGAEKKHVDEKEASEEEEKENEPTPSITSSSGSSSNSSGSGEHIYLGQIKRCFKLLLDCNPPDYVKLPVMQMISNELRSGGLKYRNRDYYYATIWQLVRFMSYITRQNEHLMSVCSILSEKVAYSMAAKILVFNILEFGFEIDDRWSVAREHPEVISDAVTEILTRDVITSAKLTGRFALRASNYTGQTPPRLQNTPITLRTRCFATLAGCEYSELRRAGEKSRMSEEIFGAVVTAVRAVDERLGVKRDGKGYEDFVEGMYRIPVAALNEELLATGAVTADREQYGALMTWHADPLCAIGYFNTSYSHRAEDTLNLSEITDEACVKAMSWEGSRVARFEMKSGHVQTFMWNYPIRDTALLDGVHIIFANDYELSLMSVCESEEARLDDMTQGLAREIFNGSDGIDEPYCGMQGALGLGYIISKGVGSFAGIQGADDAVALTEYGQIRQEVEKLRSDGLQLSTSNLRIYDLETLALPRVVERKPTNMKIGLYLSAIKVATNAKDVGASEITYRRPIGLPDVEERNKGGLSYWASTEEDSKTIEGRLRKRIRETEVKLDSLRGVRNGKILAKSSLPLDVLIVMIGSIGFAIVPSILGTGGDTSERMTNGIQNVGMGAIPIIAVYVMVFYFRWGPHDMLRAQRACGSLEEAGKAAGVSVVEVVEEVARKGWGAEVLATAGASLALRGGSGNGVMSCGVGVSLVEYAKVGLIVLSKDGVLERVIGRDWSVELKENCETGVWYASKAGVMHGYYREASEEEMHVLVG